jgi:predicted dehydrogenase
MALGIGLIGYGHWGPNYARVFSELPDTELVGICESSKERMNAAANRHKDVTLTASAAELLADSKIGAVVIATPASTHLELAKAALESGRDVLLEKPMAMTADECRRLTDMAVAGNRILMIGHTFLYNQGVRKVKECMNLFHLGRLYYVHTTRTNLGPIRKDVGAIWDLAPHDVSIFDYLLEAVPTWVSATGTRVLSREREDVGFVTLGYPGDVIANIHVSWADPNKVRELVVVGSNRRIVFDDLNAVEPVRIFEKGVAVSSPNMDDFGFFKLAVRDGDIVSPKVPASEPLKALCAEFVQCVGNRKPPLSDAACGTRVVQVMEAISKSLSQNGAPVEV